MAKIQEYRSLIFSRRLILDSQGQGRIRKGVSSSQRLREFPVPTENSFPFLLCVYIHEISGFPMKSARRVEGISPRGGISMLSFLNDAETVVPSPGKDSRAKDPPHKSASCFRKGSPKPTLRSVLEVKKGSTTDRQVCSSMPFPYPIQSARLLQDVVDL